MEMSSANTDWAWPWWTVIVVINAINLVVCLMVYKRSLNHRGGADATYRAVFVSRYMTQMAWFDSIANSSLQQAA